MTRCEKPITIYKKQVTLVETCDKKYSKTLAKLSPFFGDNIEEEQKKTKQQLVKEMKKLAKVLKEEKQNLQKIRVCKEGLREKLAPYEKTFCKDFAYISKMIDLLFDKKLTKTQLAAYIKTQCDYGAHDIATKVLHDFDNQKLHEQLLKKMNETGMAVSNCFLVLT